MQLRYTGIAQALHWITVAALCFLLPFVWVAENFPPGPVRTLWYLLHESMGVTVLLLVIIRLTWRWRHVGPPPPATVSQRMQIVAKLNHWLLYAILLVMPVTGYLMAGNGQSVPYFGIISLPALPKNDPLGVAANQIHVWGQFVLYGLVVLHVAATAWHVAIRRDGLLSRMLPPQANERE